MLGGKPILCLMGKPTLQTPTRCRPCVISLVSTDIGLRATTGTSLSVRGWISARKKPPAQCPPLIVPTSHNDVSMDLPTLLFRNHSSQPRNWKMHVISAKRLSWLELFQKWEIRQGCILPQSWNLCGYKRALLCSRMGVLTSPARAKLR